MDEKILGNVHSIESCGTVDGPGIRFVVFMQGCPMRCLYCHNPDSWGVGVNFGTQMPPLDIISRYEGVKEFCKGGITVTGGEPLLQIDFVTELFRLAKEKKIHTALDTSGITFVKENIEKFDKLLEYTDLVLLDIKHIDDEEHKKLTGHSNKNILEFAKYLSEKNISTWIRHVVVPTINDKIEYLRELGTFLATLDSVKALDMLPYHNMAEPKYKSLGLEYPLKGIEPASKEEIMKARFSVFRAYKEAKKYSV